MLEKTKPKVKITPLIIKVEKLAVEITWKSWAKIISPDQPRTEKKIMFTTSKRFPPIAVIKIPTTQIAATIELRTIPKIELTLPPFIPVNE